MSSAASRPPKSLSQSVSQPVSQPASQPSEPTAASTQNGAIAGTSFDPKTGRTASQAGEQAKSDSSLRQPPRRPQLMGPPARPQPPAATDPEPTAAVSAPPAAPAEPQRIGPISAPSERMQYRAIGLLKGKYVASEEQFNRGDIAVEDGTLIDAVLLGRVTSLIKKHIDLEQDHLWVVYPRTLYKDDESPALHVQIVGVWEPETLNGDNDDDDDTADEPKAADPKYLSTAEATEQCDVFSIRGEIAKYAEEKNEITVNIVQKSKSENVKPKRPFKLLVSGQLSGRATGYFWDLQVERQAGQLMLKEATQIAVVPPKKKSKDVRGKGGNRRRSAPAGKPRGAGAPVPKPVPKPKPTAEQLADSPAERSADKRVEKAAAEKLAE